MKLFLFSLLTLAVNFAQANGTIHDGKYSGNGTWSSVGPAGNYEGELELAWTQNGELAENLGVLKLQGMAIQTFNDKYSFHESAPGKYDLKRLIDGKYQSIGSCTYSLSGNQCNFQQATNMGELSVVEHGFLPDDNTLIRIGTMTSKDGTVTTYSAILTKVQ